MIYRTENLILRFDHMYCDFVREAETGKWYFLQCKGFELMDESVDQVLLWNVRREKRLLTKNSSDTAEEDGSLHIDWSKQPGKKGKRKSSFGPTGKSSHIRTIQYLLDQLHNKQLARNQDDGDKGALVSSKERIQKLASERGLKCKLCGLHFHGHDALVVITTPSKQSMEQQQTVPAFGYCVTISRAVQLVHLFMDYNHSQSYMGGKRIQLTKYARELYAHRLATEAPSLSRLQDPAFLTMHECSTILCCYYCNELVDTYSDYISTFRRLHAFLGNTALLSTHSPAVEGGEKRGRAVGGNGAEITEALMTEMKLALTSRAQFLRELSRCHGGKRREESMMDSVVSSAFGITSLLRASREEKATRSKGSGNIRAWKTVIHPTFHPWQQVHAMYHSRNPTIRNDHDSKRELYQWRMFFLAHFLTDFNNEWINEVLREVHSGERNKKSHAVRAVGVLVYSLGTRTVVMEFPLVPELLQTGEEQTKQQQTSGNEKRDMTVGEPVIWIQQCRYDVLRYVPQNLNCFVA